MHYLRGCLFSLVTPWGRLSPVPFAAMAFLVIGAHCAIQMHINELGEDLQPYNAWSMSLFLLMWPIFCLTSRRFHDGGKSAFWLVPLLIVTFASYLAVLDSLHLASSVFDEDRDALRWSERGRLALQIAAMVAMIVALVRPGDIGENAFGLEFDQSTAGGLHAAAAHAATRKTAKAPPTAADRKQAVAHHGEPATPLASGQPTPRRRATDHIPSGPRGRITPGGPRTDGFGRR